MAFYIRRTDGVYAKAPHQKNKAKGTIRLSAPVTWRSNMRGATQFQTRLDAEQVAGQMQNPPRGTDIEVIEA